MGPVAGGPSVVRLRQEGNLALQHEVKLCGMFGGGVEVELVKHQADQAQIDPAPPIPQSYQPSAIVQVPSANYQAEETCDCQDSDAQKKSGRRELRTEETLSLPSICPGLSNQETLSLPSIDLGLSREEIFNRREQDKEETLILPSKYPGLVLPPPPPLLLWPLRLGQQKIPYRKLGVFWGFSHPFLCCCCGSVLSRQRWSVPAPPLHNILPFLECISQGKGKQNWHCSGVLKCSGSMSDRQ